MSLDGTLMSCLLYLHQHERVPASRIVNHAGMDKMMVSDLMTLVRTKLVKRKPNPEDGRSLLLELTRLGEVITNSAVLKIEALDSDFLKKVKDIASFHKDLASLVA